MAIARVEPTTSTTNKEVKIIQEKGGIWSFLKKFPTLDVELATTLVHSWKEGKVVVRGIQFRVIMELVNREKSSLKNEVDLFHK